VWKESARAVKEAREKYNNLVHELQAHPDYKP
jgi:hypothetical protein